MPLQESDLAGKTAAQRRALKLDYLISDLPSRLPVQWQYAHPTRGNIGVRVFGVGYKSELLRLDVEAQLMANGKPLAVASPIFILNQPMKTGAGVWNQLQALRESIQHTVGLMPALKDGQVVDDADPTLTIYPDADPESATVDGYAEATGTNQVFSTLRGASGTGSGDTDTSFHVRLTAGTTTDRFALIRRGFFLFDTRSIASGDTISSVTLSLFLQGRSSGLGAPDLDIVTSSPASNTALANSDYGNIGSTPLASLAYASHTLSAYNDYTLSVGDVVKAGITKLGARLSWDTDNSFTGTWASGAATYYALRCADNAGTTNDPKLVVVYSAAAASRRVMLIS